MGSGEPLTLAPAPALILTLTTLLPPSPQGNGMVMRATTPADIGAVGRLGPLSRAVTRPPIIARYDDESGSLVRANGAGGLCVRVGCCVCGWVGCIGCAAGGWY